MAEIFIESLSIENFGQYYGKHEFQFSPLDGRCGILIGGKNGAGKTHLLRALYLAVVGESGVADLKRVETGSDATRFAFDKSLNRKAQAEGADTTTLSVTLLQRARGTGSRRVKLTREIRHLPKSPPVWRSYAEKSDNSGVIEDEEIIQKLRDTFLPRHLARFFFFDAERSQSINLGQEDIVEGISRILGLWTYRELEIDLRNLIQNKIRKVFSPSTAAHEVADKLADINGKITSVEGHLKARKKEQRAVDLELNEIAAELVETEDELKSIGAVDPEELTKAHNQRLEISRLKSELESQLTEAWERAMPIALLGAYRRELHDALVKEETRRDWEGSKAAVEPKIPQVKQDVFEDVDPEYALQDDVHAYYVCRLEKALHRLFHPAPDGMADRLYITSRNDISAQIRSKLTSIPVSLKGLADLCVQLENLDSKLRQIEFNLKQLQQSSAAMERGQQLHEKRGTLRARQVQLQQRQRNIHVEIQQLENELSELRREETNLQDISDKAEKGQSLIARAARYRDAVAEIQAQAAIQLREKISECVGDLWIEITERQREFRGLEFDNHWRCFLIRRDDSWVPWEEINASAGQRQVRMLAFYESLRRLAQLVPPLVVDTPLGRLDKEVRENVLNRLYLSGHQSLILSTNSEIDPDGPLFDRIKDRIARVYTLVPHGKPDSSDYEVRVTGDYFGRTL